jgi:hypothetical protein
MECVRTTRVSLATGHRVHDLANNTVKNLAAFRQRCHTYCHCHCRGHAGDHENGCVRREEAGGKDDPRLRALGNHRAAGDVAEEAGHAVGEQCQRAPFYQHLRDLFEEGQDVGEAGILPDHDQKRRDQSHADERT